MTTTVTAADLAVGQVWRSTDIGDTTKIVRIVDGVVFYTVDSGDYEHQWSASRFAAWADECAVLDTSPIPHPSAIGDLYAACKAIVQRWDDARLDDNDMDGIRAAIAKAEGGGK